MSTMRFDNIDDGVTQVSTTALRRGRANAWVKFQGDGVVAVNGSYATSSITDNGIGDYAQNFSAVMPDVNYAVGGCASNNRNSYPGTVNSAVSLSTAGAPLTGTIRVTGAYTYSPVVSDARDMSVTVHGATS